MIIAALFLCEQHYMTDQIIDHTDDHQDRVIKGVIFALTAFACFALTNAFAKLLSDTHHVVELVFWRNFIVFMPFVLFILVSRKWDILKTGKPIAVMTRAIMATATLGVTFTSYKLLPMADATVLLFAASLILPVLGFLFLKEHVGPYRWIAIIIGFCGVAYMAQPSGHVVMIGVIAALIAALMQAIMMTIARYIKTEDPMTATFYLISLGTILPAFIMPFFWQPLAPENISLFLGMGITGGIAQLCIVNAFKNAPAAFVAALNYTGLIWAAGLDILIWDHIPGGAVFIGGGIIIASSLFIIYRENMKKNHES